VKFWAWCQWRRFLLWAVGLQGGTIVRAHGVADVRGALAQSLDHIARYEGPPRRLKGRLREVVQRTLDVWDAGLPWTVDGKVTPLDQKVMQTLVK
jgi:hypothetical protein